MRNSGYESNNDSNNESKLINSKNLIENLTDSFGYEILFPHENLIKTRSSRKGYNVIINSDVEKMGSE